MEYLLFAHILLKIPPDNQVASGSQNENRARDYHECYAHRLALRCNLPGLMSSPTQGKTHPRQRPGRKTKAGIVKRRPGPGRDGVAGAGDPRE
jgi:hypothetical protein